MAEQTHPEIDSFSQQVTSEKARIDSDVDTEKQQHELEIEQRCGESIKLKERLSKFAREHKLDEALVELWEEIHHYPAWSIRKDFEKWNKLNLTGINGSSEEETKSVEFMHGTQRFKVTKKEWSGMESSHFELSFFEDGNEVFAVDWINDGSNDHDRRGISAFKKSGNWAKVLLEFYGKIRIEKNKLLDNYLYSKTEEIKTRFEE